MGIIITLNWWIFPLHKVQKSFCINVSLTGFVLPLRMIKMQWAEHWTGAMEVLPLFKRLSLLSFYYSWPSVTTNYAFIWLCSASDLCELIWAGIRPNIWKKKGRHILADFKLLAFVHCLQSVLLFANDSNSFQSLWKIGVYSNLAYELEIWVNTGSSGCFLLLLFISTILFSTYRSVFSVTFAFMWSTFSQLLSAS